MTNNAPFFLITLPIISGLCLFFLGQKEALKKNLSLLVFSLSLVFSFLLFVKPDFYSSIHLARTFTINLGLDRLSRLILIFANIFGLLICLYSKDYMAAKKGYFSWLLLLLAFSNLEILSRDFSVFILAWGASILILYAFLAPGSRACANKAITILGFSYICFIVGAYLYCMFSGTQSMFGGQRLIVDRPVPWVIFMLMLIGALAKTGCMPLHTWIPTASQTAPVTVMAILPSSLDKLLGIYILSRICLDFFVLNSFIIALLLLVGSFTIIFAVMMALIQHDLRKLLAFHAISQAGYMVLGLGTGNPIGIIGAIFHMFNNAIYKNGLFLVGGAVHKKKGTFELDALGGLSRYMPYTFAAGLILSLSISGIPPFNGFASKWLIYQGTLFGLSSSTGPVLKLIYVFALIAAMFGSALTLASFIKFIHAIFLGQDHSSKKENSGESSVKMLIPVLTLACFCVAIGVFSHFFMNKFLLPCFDFSLSYGGNWNSLFVTALLGISLILGFILWALMPGKRVRQDNLFIGGEAPAVETSFPATEFYKTIQNLPLLRKVYGFLNTQNLDIYNILTGIFMLKWFLGKRKK